MLNVMLYIILAGLSHFQHVHGGPRQTGCLGVFCQRD